MFFSLAIAAYLACHTEFAYAHTIPYLFKRTPQNYTPVTPMPADIHRDLGPQLAKNALIYSPGSPEYANATSRWNVYEEPNISVVVQPGNDNDVATIVSMSTYFQYQKFDPVD